MDQSVRVSKAIFEDWNNYYPFSWMLQYYNIESSFKPKNNVSDYGYYAMDAVPYQLVDREIVDKDTGKVTSVIKYPDVLEKTIFVALNTLACNVENRALYETFNDPGAQLAWLEGTLVAARKNGKSAIIAGN